MTEKHSDYLRELPDGSVDITLDKVAVIGGVDVTALTMREPTVRDSLAVSTMKATAAHQEVALFANLCGVAPADIEGLSMRNYGRLQEAYMGFTD